MLIAALPDRKHELHHVAEDGTMLELFGSDNTDGFDAQVTRILDTLRVGEQLIVFLNRKPMVVTELDFDGNEVVERLS